MNKYYRNLILGFFLMLALFLFNLSATFSYSFLNIKQYIQIMETSGSIISLQKELIESLEQTIERINISCDTSECLSVNLLHDVIHEKLMNKNTNDFLLDCDWEASIQQVYETNHWKFNSDKIKVIAEAGISLINQRMNHHLIFSIADIANNIKYLFLVIIIFSLIVCSILYSILHKNKKLCTSILVSSILMQLILIGLLSLDMMERITIGYSVQSAYMFFQALLNKWKTSLWFATFIDIGVLAFFVKSIFLTKNNK